MAGTRTALYAALLAGGLVGGGGCGARAPAVQIPANARLLFYGTATQDLQLDNLPLTGAGALYLYDDQTGRVECVLPAQEGSAFNFNGIPRGHKFRIYFVPDPATTQPAAAPATRPAVWDSPGK